MSEFVITIDDGLPCGVGTIDGLTEAATILPKRVLRRRFVAFVESMPAELPTKQRFTLIQAALLVEWGEEVWPGDLVEQTGYSEDLVRRIAVELVEAGALTFDQTGIHVALPGVEFAAAR